MSKYNSGVSAGRLLVEGGGYFFSLFQSVIIFRGSQPRVGTVLYQQMTELCENRIRESSVLRLSASASASSARGINRIKFWLRSRRRVVKQIEGRDWCYHDWQLMGIALSHNVPAIYLHCGGGALGFVLPTYGVAKQNDWRLPSHGISQHHSCTHTARPPRIGSIAG